MDLSRISSRTWLRMTLALFGFIILAFFLNKLHKRSQSYEGVVVRIHWIRAIARPSPHILLARIETPGGRQVKADVTYCGKISEGDYVVKPRGYECPSVLRRARDMRSSKGIPDGAVPLFRRNPDLTRQLGEYEETR